MFRTNKISRLSLIVSQITIKKLIFKLLAMVNISKRKTSKKSNQMTYF